MEDALAAMDADHGGIDGFLTGPAGMDPKTLDQLRSDLVC
jgi:hypothetical protein